MLAGVLGGYALSLEASVDDDDDSERVGGAPRIEDLDIVFFAVFLAGSTRDRAVVDDSVGAESGIGAGDREGVGVGAGAGVGEAKEE